MNRRRTLFSLLALLFLVAVALLGSARHVYRQWNPVPPPRQAFVKGRILTMDADSRITEAVLIEEERIAFVGQAPVKVRGPVRAGDYILPSGKEDGSGIAVAPSRLSGDDLGRVVGRAWESSDAPGLKRINAVVGLASSAPDAGALTERVETQQRTFDDLLLRIAALTERLRRLEMELDRH